MDSDLNVSQNPLIIELFTHQLDPVIAKNLCILLLDWIKKDPFKQQSRQLAMIQAYSEQYPNFHLEFLDILYASTLTKAQLSQFQIELKPSDKITILQRFLWIIALFYVITTHTSEQERTVNQYFLLDRGEQLQMYIHILIDSSVACFDLSHERIHHLTCEFLNINIEKVMTSLSLDTMKHRVDYFLKLHESL